ncbi:MAG: response regulator, partial [Bdellovibrionota bacterium]
RGTGGVMRVLVLEDDVPTAKCLSSMLQALGHEPLVAYSLDRAVQSFEAGGIDLILTDYALPKGHGVQFIKEIRTKSQSVPIVLLTNYSMPHMHAEALHAGANETAFKSMPIEALERILEKYGV